MISEIVMTRIGIAVIATIGLTCVAAYVWAATTYPAYAAIHL